MFQKILVPLDRGDKHAQALEIAAGLAKQGQAEVTLLHVIEVIAGLSMDEERTFYDRLERSARRHLEQWSRTLAAQNIPWQAKVLYGHRAPEVARYAVESGSDLIVLTAPRPDPKDPVASWGSLSYKVGILAPGPVLLVK